VPQLPSSSSPDALGLEKVGNNISDCCPLAALILRFFSISDVALMSGKSSIEWLVSRKKHVRVVVGSSARATHLLREECPAKGGFL